MQACKDGREEAARLALRSGASPKAIVRGKSCLWTAGKYGNNEIAQLLLRGGADPNEIIDRQGNTLLNWAAAEGNFGFAIELLKYKADPSVANHSGQTPLLTACRGENEFIVNLILSTTGQISDAAGNSPLHVAAQFGTKSMCILLLHRGAFIDRQNADGVTPLYAARLAGRQDIVELLMANGADDSIMPFPARQPERVKQLMIDFDSEAERPAETLTFVSKVAEGEKTNRGADRSDGWQVSAM
jgi:ankyrin repeat protein